MLCICNGMVHDGLGNHGVMDILIDQGKIASIGQDLAKLATQVIDASGKLVFPGFVDTMSELGMAVRRGEARDNDEKTDPITPELKAMYAYDGDCVMEQAPFTYGITSLAASASNSNIIGGQMAVFKTHGINPFKMLVRDEVGMKCSLTHSVKEAYGSRNVMPMTQMGMISLLKESLRNAKQATEATREEPRNEKNKAMAKVLNGDMPLMISANDSREYRSALRVCQEYSLKPVLAHGYDIHQEDMDLIEKTQGVIVGNLSYGFNSYAKKADLKGLYELVKKGLKVCFATIGNNPNGKESLLWTAGRMMQACHDSEAVLAMLTHHAAEILGCADRIGSLQVGLDADLVIWSANPIETYQAHVVQVIMDGKIVYVQGGYQQ